MGICEPAGFTDQATNDGYADCTAKGDAVHEQLQITLRQQPINCAWKQQRGIREIVRV